MRSHHACLLLAALTLVSEQLLEGLDELHASGLRTQRMWHAAPFAVAKVYMHDVRNHASMFMRYLLTSCTASAFAR